MADIDTTPQHFALRSPALGVIDVTVTPNLTAESVLYRTLSPRLHGTFTLDPYRWQDSSEPDPAYAFVHCGLTTDRAVQPWDRPDLPVLYGTQVYRGTRLPLHNARIGTLSPRDVLVCYRRADRDYFGDEAPELHACIVPLVAALAVRWAGLRPSREAATDDG